MVGGGEDRHHAVVELLEKGHLSGFGSVARALNAAACTGAAGARAGALVFQPRCGYYVDGRLTVRPLTYQCDDVGSVLPARSMIVPECLDHWLLPVDRARGVALTCQRAVASSGPPRSMPPAEVEVEGIHRG